jgi:ketosteroid isomerase-like protein
VTQENVELVRRIHEAWDNKESLDGMVAEDVEYVNPDYAVEPGIRRGHDSFELVRNTIDDIELEIERIVDTPGDEVVVLVRYSALGPGSGMELAGEQGYIWTIRDGLAVRFRWFASQREALNAVGIYED